MAFLFQNFIRNGGVFGLFLQENVLNLVKVLGGDASLFAEVALSVVEHSKLIFKANLVLIGSSERCALLYDISVGFTQ